MSTILIENLSKKPEDKFSDYINFKSFEFFNGAEILAHGYGFGSGLSSIWYGSSFNNDYPSKANIPYAASYNTNLYNTGINFLYSNSNLYTYLITDIIKIMHYAPELFLSYSPKTWQEFYYDNIIQYNPSYYATNRYHFEFYKEFIGLDKIEELDRLADSIFKEIPEKTLEIFKIIDSFDLLPDVFI